MDGAVDDEWGIVRRLLPSGWREAARESGAFQRARYITDPDPLLRVLLFHAVNTGGLRDTVQKAAVAGVVSMSQVALLKRLRTSGDWLAWLGQEICRDFRQSAPSIPSGMRLRAIDATTVQGPASKGTEWRIHYTLDLLSLQCDWHELTDAKGAEGFVRAPVSRGDVLIGDRAYTTPKGVEHVTANGGNVLGRLRWNHSWMLDEAGEPFFALESASRKRTGEPGDWPVTLIGQNDEDPVEGRVVSLRFPKPIGVRAEQRAQKRSARRGRRVDDRTLRAAHFIMLFTTLPAKVIDSVGVLELYRYRWQIELAFKRLKQLLALGKLPHREPDAARGWIHSKLVVALLLERLYRNADSISPWGYELRP